MRRILAIVRRAFGQSDSATDRLPPLRMITYLPEPVSESRNVKQLPPAPAPDHDKTSDDDLELRLICEAIGLDVKEVTGSAPLGARAPIASHDLNRDLSRDRRNDDLSQDVSADVLRLIEQVEATHEQKPGLRPSAGDESQPATPSRETHEKSSRLSNRESTQTPIARESDLADVLASLKLRLLKIRLAPDDMDEAQAEITTAIAQLLSPRPKTQIIALSLTTLVSILEKAGPATLTKDIETSLVRLRAFLLQVNA